MPRYELHDPIHAGLLVNIFIDASGSPGFANVKSLLHMDGADGSRLFREQIVTSRTIAAFGNAQISTAQSKFGGSSLLLDGTGDYLTVSPGVTFGAANMCVEMWVRTSGTNNYATLACRPSPSSFSAGAWSLMYNNAANNGRLVLFVADFSTGAPLAAASSGTVNDGNWHHVAWTRNGSTHTLWLDGVSVGTGTFSGSVNSLPSPVYVGFDPNFSGRDVNGYIDEFAVTITDPRYTAGFTPPVAAYDSSDSLWDKITVLSHFDGTNGSTSFSEVSVGRVYAPVGDAQIDTAQSKFGGASGLFDGTGDWLVNDDWPSLEFGASDMCVEFWVHRPREPQRFLV